MRDDDLIFLETTRRLAPPSLAREDVRAALALLRPALAGGGVLADLGCGYGRHLAALHEAGVRAALGIDRSAALLAEARKLAPSARLLRADLRALPLRDGSLAAAACFYSSMFLGTEGDARAALREAARALRPRGLLVLTTDNPLRLRAQPRSSFAEEVAGLGLVREESEFDPKTGLDTVRRSVGARTALFTIRYFLPHELAALAGPAGLRLLDAPLDPGSPQLVALLQRESNFP